MQIEPFKTYECQIKIRKEYEGNPVKTGALCLDGRKLNLRTLWLQKDYDKYPGEWAMEDESNELMELTGGEVSWLSSGDIEVLKEKEN